MSYKGTVKNGVVVLEPGASLPEGASVRVEPEVEVEQAAFSLKGEEDPLWDMGKYAVDCGVSDLAVNLDHYLYGHPKVINGG